MHVPEVPLLSSKYTELLCIEEERSYKLFNVEADIPMHCDTSVPLKQIWSWNSGVSINKNFKNEEKNENETPHLQLTRTVWSKGVAEVVNLK